MINVNEFECSCPTRKTLNVDKIINMVHLYFRLVQYCGSLQKNYSRTRTNFRNWFLWNDVFRNLIDSTKNEEQMARQTQNSFLGIFLKWFGPIIAPIISIWLIEQWKILFRQLENSNTRLVRVWTIPNYRIKTFDSKPARIAWNNSSTAYFVFSINFFLDLWFANFYVLVFLLFNKLFRRLLSFLCGRSCLLWQTINELFARYFGIVLDRFCHRFVLRSNLCIVCNLMLCCSCLID